MIDWFTVAAQAVNFLVLIWLLKRYLYRPILDAIDARERRIAAALADAATKQTEAQRQYDDYVLKTEEFERQRTALYQQATVAAENEKSRLLAEAGEMVGALQAKRIEALHNESRQLQQALEQRIKRTVFDITRKTLADLASADLERLAAELFVRRLRQLDEPAKAALAVAVETAAAPALLRSAFELPDVERESLLGALRECFGQGLDVRFETATAVGGIEFVCNGRKLAWSITEYLQDMERDVDELLNRHGVPVGRGAADG